LRIQEKVKNRFKICFFFLIKCSIIDIEVDIMNKEWMNLTLKQIQKITDQKKRREYMDEVRKIIKLIINPLYDRARKIGFNDKEFRTLETLSEMVECLKQFYESKGIDSEERRNIIKGIK